MENIDEIMKKLHEAFTASGMTYIDLAEKTGISKSTLQRYLAGVTKKPPFDNLIAICDALNVDLASLLGWNRSSAVSDKAAKMAEIVSSLTPKNQEFLFQQAALLILQQQSDS